MDDDDRYAISRIDLPESGTYGWQVRISRGGRRFSKFFSDVRCGGVESGFEEARRFRDELIRRLPAPTRAGAEGKLTRRNVSGVVGVSRIIVRTKLKFYTFWQATWSTSPGVRRRVKFSVSRYGEEQAFELACEARRDGERTGG